MNSKINAPFSAKGLLVSSLTAVLLCLFALSIYEESMYTSIYRWAGSIPSDLKWLSVAEIAEYRSSYGGKHWITKEPFAFGLSVGVLIACALWVGVLLIKHHWRTAAFLMFVVFVVSMFAVFGSIAQAARQWPMEEFNLSIMSEIDEAFMISSDIVSDQSTINIEVPNLDILQVSDRVVIYGIKRHLFNSVIPLRIDNPYFGRKFSNEFSSSIEMLDVPEGFKQCLDSLNDDLAEVGGVVGAERLLSRKENLSEPQDEVIRFLTLKYRDYAFVVVQLSEQATAKGFSSTGGLELVVEKGFASETNIVEQYTVVQAVHEYAPYELSSPDAMFESLVNYGPIREWRSFKDRIGKLVNTWKLVFGKSILENAIDDSKACRLIS